MDLEIRPIGEDELPAFMRTVGIAFGAPPSEREVELRRTAWSFEYDRSLAAFVDGELVATASAISFELTLPSARRLPVAGVAGVGVLPTHRRRGILRALMTRQLADVAARGEALAILKASESVIYGRFGYGLATSTLNLSIERQHARFARPVAYAGRVRLISHEEALGVLPALYERVRETQAGALNRDEQRWAEFLYHPEATADGFGPRFYAVAESPSGEVEAATFYRIQSRWEEGIANSVLQTTALFGVTAEAQAALWQFLFTVDLVPTFRAIDRPVDEPLRWLLADPRRLRVTMLKDDLWVRLLDIPAALSARGYVATGRIVFAVEDSFRPETAGRFALEVGADGAECRATETEADLALGVADLGAAYLGGVSFHTLARAGRVRELRAGALAQADALFATVPAPWCATWF